MAAQPLSLTLYTAKICPFAHRVEIALAVAGADYKRFEIDLQNKPEWYALKVNPVSKIPAIAYGGPDVAPEQPSPESAKLAESLILVEFVADLYPNAGILPSDPIQRAKTRFFADMASNKFVSKYTAHVINGAPAADIIAGAEAVQDLLPQHSKYAMGDQLTAADIAFIPFALRAEHVLALRDPENVWPTLQSERFARFNQYIRSLKAHPAVASTWDEVHFTAAFRRLAAAQKW